MEIKRETIVVNLNKVLSIDYEERVTKKKQFSIAMDKGVLLFNPFHGDTNADTERMFNSILNGLKENKDARFLVLDIAYDFKEDFCEIESFLYI